MFRKETNSVQDVYGCDDEGLPPLPSGLELTIEQIRQPGHDDWPEADEEAWRQIAASREMHAGGGVPSGAQIWPAAAALCRWQRSEAESFRGASVLELGAGTGACGLYAAGLGASRVLLTDGGDRGLPTTVNSDGVPTSSMETTVERQRLTRLMDENVRRNEHLFVPGADVRAAPFRWGVDTLPEGPFDWVIASDCTYTHDAHEALASTLAALLRAERSPRVVLAHGHRCPPAARRYGLHLDRWDQGDLALADFIAAANRNNLDLRLLAAERPHSELSGSLRRWTSDLSVFEAVAVEEQ